MELRMADGSALILLRVVLCPGPNNQSDTLARVGQHYSDKLTDSTRP